MENDADGNQTRFFTPIDEAISKISITYQIAIPEMVMCRNCHSILQTTQAQCLFK